MAQILITGPFAQIEPTQDEDASEVTATCVDHVRENVMDKRLAEPCGWVMHFSSFEAAICTPFAEDHADTGRMDS